MSCSNCGDCDRVACYLNNDHTLTLEGLVFAGTALSDATVTYQIYDADNDAVTGATGTLTETGTDGTYSAEVDKDIINLMNKGEYTIRIEGAKDGIDFEFNLDINTKRRGSS